MGIVAVATLSGMTVACASVSAKENREITRRLADRDAALRRALDRQYDLQTELGRTQDHLARARADLDLSESRLRRLLGVEAELTAQKAQYEAINVALQEAQRKIQTRELSSKGELIERRRACEQSIPDKELAAYNRALVDVFKSLEVRGEPRVARGMLGDTHYLNLELRVAGQRLWEQTIKTTGDDNPISGALRIVGDIATISGLLRGAPPK